MAQIVKLRRSSVSGQKPTNSNLQLGELALNTTDGKVYMAVSGSLGPTVEELILTNTVNTGSIHLVGDVTASIFTGSFKGNGSGLYNIPSSGVTGLELNKIISGSVSASISPDRGFEVNTNTTITGSINVSSDVSASNFTGSFIGDGSGLYNIPSTGITGLNLSQISSGSVSASISPNNGLVINTNTTITGSLTVSGSFNYVGPQSITGSQQISGSISLYPTNDPDPLGQTTTATHLFVSASNNQTGEDLYIRQQDNKVKWKWFEGKLNSGILWGGALSYSGSTIYITPGSGIIIDQRASATSEISPITHYVNWNAITASCQNLTSSLATYVGIDMSGSLYQQNNYFSVNQYRETIPLGMFNHTNKSSITSYANDVLTAYDDVNQTANFIQAFGPLKLEGLMLTPQSGNLQLTIGSGQSYIYGGFYQQDPNNSSHKITAPIITPQIARVRRDGNGSFIVDNNNGAFYTTIDPSKWDDGTGTLNSLGGGSYAIQRVFFNPFTTRVHVYYGQSFYGTKTAAFQSLASDSFVEAQYSAHQYVLVGYIIHKGGTSNLANDENQIIQAGLFRNTVGSGGGTGTFASLHDLDDVDIINPNNGDLLVYNSTTNLWEHSKQLTGDYQITGSLFITEGLTGSLDFNNLTNVPTLVSGSSQIDITGTDGYTTYSSSVNDRMDTITSSITFLSSSVKDRIDLVTSSITSLSSSVKDSIDNVTSSITFLSSSVKDRIDLVTSSVTFLSSSVKDRIDVVTGSITFLSSSVKDRIDVVTGSITSLSSSVKDRIDIVTGSIDSLNSFTASYSTGSFTGSFKGDGSGLYNIPASGVTGLQLDKIVSGNASASIDNNGFYVNRDVYIDGTITAKEIHIDYVTSSVLYQSGSTKFGNTSDDTHQFTGSINVTNGITGSLQGVATGNLNYQGIWNGTIHGYYLVNDIVKYSGSLYYVNNNVFGNTTPDIDTSYTLLSDITPTGSFLTTSSFESFTGSYTTGSFTGSFIGDATYLTNVPFYISGSDISGNTFNKTFTKLQFDDSTGLNVEETDPGTAFISIGSHFKDIFVSGSPLLSATGSDAFEIIPQGGIEITTSITDTNGNGYVKELNISTTNLSSSLNDRMDIITGSVDSLNTFSSSVVLTSETASMTVLSASYAMTAAFALNAGGGGEGKTYVHNQTSPSTTWTVTHNLGESYPSIEVFDSLGNVIIPTNILTQTSNTIVVTFSSAQTGKVSVTVGGGLPHISASYVGYVLATDGSEPSWKGGIISGSQQLANLGYATTGSNTFNGNQIISGTTTIGIATMGSKCVTISSNQQIFNLGVFDGANFDYVVKNGTNMRAGLIMSAWNGSSAVYNESSTMDLGSTSGVTFTVSNTGALNANISSGTWTIEVLYRALGCGTTSPTSTNYFISNGFSAPNYCDGLFGSNNSVYGDFSDWLDVTRFYTNSSLTTPFNGDNKYYGNSTADYGTTLQIDSNGYVIGNYAC